VPCTVTVPDSGGGGLTPLLPPPQLRAATSDARSIAPKATCRACALHRTDRESRRRRTIRTRSSKQAAHAAGPAVNGWSFCGTGEFDAEDDAVIVTVAVLLLLSAPSEHVTPNSELETLQEKLTLLAERPLSGANVRVEPALPPGLIVKVPGETLREKSGGTVVKLKTLDQAPYTPGEGDKAFTCQ